MAKIEFKGYTAVQASNNHVMIAKDGKMVLHSQCDEKKTSGELKAMIEAYITLTESGEIDRICNEEEESEGMTAKEYIELGAYIAKGFAAGLEESSH